MSWLSAKQDAAASGNDRVVLWSKIVAAFLTAISAQALFERAPVLFGLSGYHVLGRLQLPVVLAFFFAPGFAAALYGLHRVSTFYRQVGRSVPMLAVAVIILLALVSVFARLLIGFISMMWET